MMGKLIKYEFKATYKTFLLMYLVLLVISVGSFVGTTIRNNYMQAVTIGTMSFAVVPVIVIYFVTVIRRYRNGLYGDEGYLMFTLPVQSWQLVGSKWIVASIWGVLTLTIGMICGMIMVSGFIIPQVLKNSANFSEFMKIIITGMQMVGMQNLVRLFFWIVVSGVNFIAMIYLCISIANLSFIRKWNAFLAVICYFVIMKLQGFINTNVVAGICGPEYTTTDYAGMNEIFTALGHIGLWEGVLMFLMAILFLVITSLLTAKKISIR